MTTSAAHHGGSQRTTSPVGLPLFDHCALSGELYQEAVGELGAVHGAFNEEPGEGSEDAACVPTEGVRRTGKRTTPVDGFVLGLRRDNVLVRGMDLGHEACLSCFPGRHLNCHGPFDQLQRRGPLGGARFRFATVGQQLPL